jgi:hypothetical protein
MTTRARNDNGRSTHSRRGVIVHALALASVALSLGCASARMRKADARAVAAADLRVLEGCYDCLLDARTVYARVAAAKDRKNAAASVVRLFETELLLSLREKELALDWRTTMDRARSLAARVPASLEPGRLLAIVDAVLPDANGVPPKALAAMRRARQPFVAKIPAELAWLARAPLRPAVRDYVRLALDCAYPVRPDVSREPYDSVKKRRQPPPNAPPLVLYRSGICAGGDSVPLHRAAVAVPAFAEASYFLGQPAAFDADETGGDDARELLGRAYRRFPKAPGVTFYLGWLGTMTGNCTEAIRYYAETIATEPAHEQAYFQRTICLTNLRQDSAAIESATRLIALETESTGQAYYWRALNRLRRKELELARSDIEMAKALTRDAENVLTLAGVIEHDQDDLQPAERDLRAARAKPNGRKNCTAAWYLGLVLNKGTRWRESATTFESAMGCYDEKISEDRDGIALLQSNPKLRPAVKAKKIELLEADIADQQGRYYTAAFNGASNNARAGETARARELLEIAARDPRLGEHVAKLREALAATGRGPTK